MAQNNLRSIIIGMMAAVLFFSLCFGIMFDMYSEDNLNIDLADDNATAPLEALQTEMEEQREQLQQDNQYIEDRVVGGEETELGKDVSQDNLVASSLTALSNTPSYIGSFFKILGSSTKAVGGQIGGAIADSMWFFVGSLIIIVAFILASSVMQRGL